jgi:predicted metal-dependent peptidase
MPKSGMHDKIANICVKWEMGAAPFFAEFLLRFVYKEDENCPTIGVGVRKRKVLLTYNKEFIDKITEEECEGVLVHEVMHLLHKYHARRDDRVHELFNIAQDACINETVLETSINGKRLTLPKDGVRFSHITKMGYNGELISEPIYDFLYDKADKIKVSIIGHGESDDSDGKQKLNTIDDHSKLEPERKTGDSTKNGSNVDELEDEVIKEIVNNAKVRNWGNISGNTISEIKELIKAKTVPWRQKLSMYLSKYVYDPGNIYENTWSKRNRRELPLPGIRKKSKKIVISIDTSGSITNDYIQMFFGQIEKIIKDYSQVTLVQWDTKVQDVSKYNKGDWRKIKVHGRGGTDVQDLYNYIKGKLKNTSILVNFTDGFFNWEIEHYNIPTIWAIIGAGGIEIPFGKKVDIIADEV